MPPSPRRFAVNLRTLNQLPDFLMKELGNWLQERFTSQKLPGIDLKEYQLGIKNHGDGTVTIMITNRVTKRTARARLAPDQMKALKTVADMIFALDAEKKGENAKKNGHVRNLGYDNNVYPKGD